MRIIDDAPVAQDDAAEIVEDTATIGGNVVAGTGAAGRGRQASAPMAAPSRTWYGCGFGGTLRTVGTRFATTYGWLDTERRRQLHL